MQSLWSLRKILTGLRAIVVDLATIVLMILAMVVDEESCMAHTAICKGNEPMRLEEINVPTLPQLFKRDMLSHLANELATMTTVIALTFSFPLYSPGSHRHNQPNQRSI